MYRCVFSLINEHAVGKISHELCTYFVSSIDRACGYIYHTQAQPRAGLCMSTMVGDLSNVTNVMYAAVQDPT